MTDFAALPPSQASIQRRSMAGSRSQSRTTKAKPWRRLCMHDFRAVAIALLKSSPPKKILYRIFQHSIVFYVLLVLNQKQRFHTTAALVKSISAVTIKALALPPPKDTRAHQHYFAIVALYAINTDKHNGRKFSRYPWLFIRICYNII